MAQCFLIVQILKFIPILNQELSAVELGHVVCILTGRPWRSTKPIYEKLGLKTIVANFNGAYIHNPTDSEFIPTINYINLNDILYIMGDKRVKAETSNVAIRRDMDGLKSKNAINN